MFPGTYKPSQLFLALLLGFALVSSLPVHAAGSKAPGDDSTVPTGSLDQSESLFKSFSGFCPSHGEWTQQARSSAKSLANALITMKDDPACKSLAGALDSLNTLQTVLDKETMTYEELEWESQKRTRFELLVQLQDAQNNNDAALVTSYEASLRDVQLRMGVLERRNELQKKDLRQRLIAQQSVSALKLIMDQATAQKECFSQSPQFFSSLVTLSSSIGAMALTGGLSLGVAAGAELVSSAVEFSRKSNLAKKINRISEASIHESFSCVLEAMSNQWCGAKEALDLHRLRMDSLGKEGHFYNGVRYLQREVPIVLNWLDKVKSGARPQNTEEANRQKVVDAKEAALKAFRSSAYAELQEKIDILPTGNSDADLKIRFETLKKAILTITDYAAYYNSTALNVSSSNPIADVFNAADIPWILAGLEQGPTTEVDNQLVILSFSGTPSQSYIRKLFEGAETIGYPFNPQVIEERIEFLYRAGEKSLNEERAKRLQVDPRQVLFAAETPVLDGVRRGSSPLQALDSLIDFLTNVNEDQMSVNTKKLYVDTRARLSKIRKIVDDAVMAAELGLGDDIADPEDPENPGDPENPFPPSTPEDKIAKNALDKVYKEARLQYGLAFMSDRLRKLIRYELYNRVIKPDEPGLDRTTSAQLLASQDILEELEVFNQTSPTIVTDDIATSLPNFQVATQGFAVTFSEQLGKTLRFYHKHAQMDADIKPAFNRLCLLLLAVPNWKEVHLREDVPLELCVGAQKKSFSREYGKPSYKVSMNSFYESFNERRACHYRSFARAEKILKDYGPHNAPTRRRSTVEPEGLGPVFR